MNDFKSSFYAHLHTLVENLHRKKFLLTISGGKDSVALAHLFYQLQLSFSLAHCNFHLRGEDSNNDMKFVQDLAKKWQIPLYVKEFDTLAEQQKTDKSIEMVARELRYHWFDEIGASFDYIVTAHHANDNAETVLLNLTRGTGLKGMIGIPEINGKYLRPLLPFTVDDILQYVEDEHLSYCIDQTNFSEIFHRNRMRHTVLPALTSINPQIIATFTRNIHHFQQQFNFLQYEIEQYRNRFTEKNDHQFSINIRELTSHPYASLLLYEFLKPYHFSFLVTREIFKALEGESGKTFFSPTHTLVKNRDTLIVQKREENQPLNFSFQTIEELTNYGFSVDLQLNNGTVIYGRNPNIIYVDAKKLQSPFQLRNWETGDYFYPFGMRGKKKLSDFFVDQKIDKFSKYQTPLLCSNGEIVWVVGLRADNRFKIDAQTTHYYKIIYHGRIGK